MRQANLWLHIFKGIQYLLPYYQGSIPLLLSFYFATNCPTLWCLMTRTHLKVTTLFLFTYCRHGRHQWHLQSQILHFITGNCLIPGKQNNQNIPTISSRTILVMAWLASIGDPIRMSFTLHLEDVLTLSDSKTINHPGLAEIPAPVGSQDVMSQLRDYPFRQWLGAGRVPPVQRPKCRTGAWIFLS